MKSRSLRKRSLIALKLFLFVVLPVFAFGLYYFIDYKRYFISNLEETKNLTIWKKPDGTCYIIPKKYRSIYIPKKNYIKTNHNSDVYIIWNPNERADALSLFIESETIEIHNLIPAVEVYKSRSDFFKRFKDEDYDSSKKIILDEDSSEYEENIYQMDYIDISFLGTKNNIIPD